MLMAASLKMTHSIVCCAITVILSNERSCNLPLAALGDMLRTLTTLLLLVTVCANYNSTADLSVRGQIGAQGQSSSDTILYKSRNTLSCRRMPFHRQCCQQIAPNHAPCMGRVTRSLGGTKGKIGRNYCASWRQKVDL